MAQGKEAVRVPELLTVLANRGKTAEIVAEKIIGPVAVIELQRQVASGAKTEIVTNVNAARIARSEAEDLQQKPTRLTQMLPKSLRQHLSLDTPHTAGRTATAARGSHRKVLSSQHITLRTARAINFFILQC